MITNILTAIVTAYVATGHPCANGKMPRAGITCASSDRTILLGSKLVMNGKTFIIEDRTNKRFRDGRFDIFFSNKHDAIIWGKQNKSVQIITQK
jgi:3D (Asp-Asp-Asp) domain-containing protein